MNVFLANATMSVNPTSTYQTLIGTPAILALLVILSTLPVFHALTGHSNITTLLSLTLQGTIGKVDCRVLAQIVTLVEIFVHARTLPVLLLAVPVLV